MTKQVAEYIDHMGGDHSIVRAARVSFANEISKAMLADELKPGDINLISFLARNNHWTPFAHTAITLRMKAPIPIRTQSFKHKQGFVENEESRRYIKSTPEYIMPVWRFAVKNKKQGSGQQLQAKDQSTENCFYESSVNCSIANYEGAIERGICEEQARFYLPQGCMVNWYWTGSLAAYARFANLRLDSHAQVEIQELAKIVSDIIQPLFPYGWEALVKG